MGALSYREDKVKSLRSAACKSFEARRLLLSAIGGRDSLTGRATSYTHPPLSMASFLNRNGSGDEASRGLGAKDLNP